MICVAPAVPPVSVFSALCQCSSVPRASAHQCHINATYQCYQCTSMPHTSAHLSCFQCHPSMPISATYQCCQSVPPI
ncbi:unnamed protein product, partial [Staurois parvus]